MKVKPGNELPEIAGHLLLDHMLNGVAYVRVLFHKDQVSDVMHLYANKAYYDLTGLPDVVGKTSSQIVPDFSKTNPDVLQRYGRVARGGPPERFENYVPSLQRWFLQSLYSPEPGHVVTVFDDITERKRLELDLHEIKERLTFALTNSNLGTWDADIPTGRVIYDQRWCDLIGFQASEFEPTISAWDKRLHPDDRERVWEVANAHLSGDSPEYQVEFRVRHKAGHWVWMHSNGRVVSRDETGQPIRMVGTSSDISARKRLTFEGSELIHRMEALLREVEPTGRENTHSRNHADTDLSSTLTRRQRQILIMIAKGLTSAAIAAKLNVATGTVITHRRTLMQKLNLHSTAEVTRFAIQQQLLTR